MSRPHRFAAVENTAIDALDSVLATGLLTKLIRARDGEEVTVEGLCRTHLEGREALSKAMRMLVANAFVVKFKIQRAATETVEENGEPAEKRGGSWYTTFTVDSVAFTAQDVAVMLADIYAGGNVKAHRVEPEHLDPGRQPAADAGPLPAAGIPQAGPDCGNDRARGAAGPRPAAGNPVVGGPTAGRPAAHTRNKTLPTETETEDGMHLAARSADGRRQAPTGSRRHTPPSSASSNATLPLTKQQHDLVQTVRALLPADLNTALGPKTPANVSAAVVTALALGRPRERTPHQLAEHRIMKRWNTYWAQQFYTGRLPRQPYGPLLAMLKDTAECGSPACDDRTDIHTGDPCTACTVRTQDRRAELKPARHHPPEPHAPPTLPPPRARIVINDTAGTRPECDGCSRWLPPHATTTLCTDCRHTTP
ncbi:hypothetical protein [Streptomyces sp. NPDC051079]|uniref:hypothetical protein n=1 Tax=Streptomyces sp. NPDC051079 TaxID=3155043 RepID=UPI00344FF29C